MDLRKIIAALLETGGSFDVTADLACYKYGNQYCVEYWYDESTIGVLDLTEEQREQAIEDEELLEFFETSEEAADFALKISKNQITENAYRNPTEKRSLREKVASVEKDDYF